MKRNIFSFSVVRRLRQSPVFAFLVAVLLCGVLAGSFTGMHIPQTEGSYVNDLARLVSSNAAGKMPTLRTVAACLAGVYGWMLAALVLGAVPGRLIWVAVLMAVRGFLLAFAAAAALVESGLWGIYISVVSIGISAVFWLPAMLLLCTAILDAGLTPESGYVAALQRNRNAVILCVLLLLGSALWRLLAVPVLLGLFSA
ncbi:MAG: hypothetical protein Q4D42_07480 [Eubacteriales bacterium]|nr:hypothetical protein [Eubacteriales bacterium]